MALIKNRADAQKAERQIAMPSPQKAARRGIIVGRYMGLSEQESALMVMTAATAAIVSAHSGGATDTSWLAAIHKEATRVYTRHDQAALSAGKENRHA